MSKQYVYEAILELKSKFGIRETLFVQRTLDKYKVKDLEKLFIFWQVYHKLRVRFIWRKVSLIQILALLIYLFTRLCSDFTFCHCFVKIECFTFAWIALAFMTWGCSYLLFVYFPPLSNRIKHIRSQSTEPKPENENEIANQTCELSSSKETKQEDKKTDSSIDKATNITVQLSASVEKIIFAYKLNE